MRTRKRLQQILAAKQQQILKETGVAKNRRDTAFMQYLKNEDIQKRTRDMKTNGIDPNTAYDQFVEEFNINYFLEKASEKRKKRLEDKIAKLTGEKLALQQDQKKEKRKKNKNRKKKNKNKKKERKNRKKEIEGMGQEDRDSGIFGLLNQPMGKGNSVFGGPHTEQITRFLPEYEPNLKEGGRKKRTRKRRKKEYKKRRTKKKRRKGRKKTRRRKS